jgi:tryptophanyl-tRNA synthetase
MASLDDTIAQRGLAPIETLARIGGLTDREVLDRLWLHEDADRLDDVDRAEQHVVTGFGPTNAPTAGTLSMIHRARDLRRTTGIAMTTVVSDLGAWCSRTTPAADLRRNTAQFVCFLERMGLSGDGASVRTHQDLETLGLAGLLCRALGGEDFRRNEEVFAALYDRLGVLGGEFGVWVDATYTVADILGPVLAGKRRVLVLAGIEEHYFVALARTALQRFVEQGHARFADAQVSAVYGRLIGGFAPYPKMSKSIPASALSLADPEDMLARRIVEERDEHADLLLQLVQLASDWSPQEIREAVGAHEGRRRDPAAWRAVAERYLQHFLAVRGVWQDAAQAIRPGLLDHMGGRA